MAKDYHPKSRPKDILVGMAEVGIALAEAPLIDMSTNNWAKVMMRPYSSITGGSPPDVSATLKKLKRIYREHQRKYQR